MNNWSWRFPGDCEVVAEEEEEEEEVDVAVAAAGELKVAAEDAPLFVPSLRPPAKNALRVSVHGSPCACCCCCCCCPLVALRCGKLGGG